MCYPSCRTPTLALAEELSKHISSGRERFRVSQCVYWRTTSLSMFAFTTITNYIIYIWALWIRKTLAHKQSAKQNHKTHSYIIHRFSCRFRLTSEMCMTASIFCLHGVFRTQTAQTCSIAIQNIIIPHGGCRPALCIWESCTSTSPPPWCGWRNGLKTELILHTRHAVAYLVAQTTRRRSNAFRHHQEPLILSNKLTD